MDSGSYVTRFDPTRSMSALDAVFDAITTCRNTDGEELPHLNRYINADAINCLFGGPNGSTTRIEEGTLSFRYDDMFVTITHNGWIKIVDADARRTQPVPYGLSAEARTQQSTEAALAVAKAALAEAEEHVWTAASNASDNELVDPLWAIVEQLWSVQTQVSNVTAQPSSTESLTTLTDDQ